MKITITGPDGTVRSQVIDVGTAARIGSVLRDAASTIRAKLVDSGVDADAANEIAIAAQVGGYAAAASHGLVLNATSTRAID